MKTKKWMLYAIVAALLTGCSSTREVLENGKALTFKSTKTAALLASCIDRNTDSERLHTSIKNTGLEPIEIIVRTGGGYVHSVVQVKSANVGSIASFHFGGVASIRFGRLLGVPPEENLGDMTKGCD